MRARVAGALARVSRGGQTARAAPQGRLARKGADRTARARALARSSSASFFLPRRANRSREGGGKGRHTACAFGRPRASGAASGRGGGGESHGQQAAAYAGVRGLPGPAVHDAGAAWRDAAAATVCNGATANGACASVRRRGGASLAFRSAPSGREQGVGGWSGGSRSGGGWGGRGGGVRGSEMEVCVPVHVAPPPIACAGCQARLLALRTHSRARTSDPARAVGAPTPGEVLRGVRQKAVGARLVACTGPFRASADAAPPGRGRARGRGRGGREAAPSPFASKPRRYPSKYLRNFSRAKRLFSRARRSRPRARGGAP